MIDKYKRARVQRPVPWRAPRASECVPQMLAGLDLRLAAQISVASIIERMATPALLSGAMPQEFNVRELRADWQ